MSRSVNLQRIDSEGSAGLQILELRVSSPSLGMSCESSIKVLREDGLVGFLGFGMKEKRRVGDGDEHVRFNSLGDSLRVLLQ